MGTKALERDDIVIKEKPAGGNTRALFLPMTVIYNQGNRLNCRKLFVGTVFRQECCLIILHRHRFWDGRHSTGCRLLCERLRFGFRQHCTGFWFPLSKCRFYPGRCSKSFRLRSARFPSESDWLTICFWTNLTDRCHFCRHGRCFRLQLQKF